MDIGCSTRMGLYVSQRGIRMSGLTMRSYRQPSQARLIRCEIVRDAPGIREASDHFPLLSEIADA